MRFRELARTRHVDYLVATANNLAPMSKLLTAPVVITTRYRGTAWRTGGNGLELSSRISHLPAKPPHEHLHHRH
jgi:hypothetical protein